MDEFTASREEVRASIKQLFNPRSFMDYLEEKLDGEIPDEIRKLILEFPLLVEGGPEEIDKIMGPAPAPKNPLDMDRDEVEARLDALLKLFLPDDQLPEEESHLLGVPGPSKRSLHESPVGEKCFEEELEFVEEPHLVGVSGPSKEEPHQNSFGKKSFEEGSELVEEPHFLGLHGYSKSPVLEEHISTRNFFEKELEFAEILGNHPLSDLLNSPLTDGNDAMPGRSFIESKVETQFQYEPIDRSTDASRLLLLQPGSFNDEIKCTLQPLPLSALENVEDKSVAPAPYEALSYVWGDQTVPQRIQMNGHHFTVGNNLFLALRHLRLEDSDRLLWIDAICINQSDIPERNWQVTQMNVIYRSAMQVIAWLGPPTKGSDLIFSALSAFQASHDGNAHLLTENNKDICECLFGDDDLEADPSLLETYRGYIHVLWDQLDQLTERPLFTRSWVVQEIVLARQADVYCGRRKLPYDIFVAAIGRASKLRKSLGLKAYMSLKAGLMKFASFEMLRHELHASQADGELPLFHLAARFGPLDATDPRDKLYAFLGLSSHLIKTGKPHSYEGFEPDYSKSVLDVFRDFALFCIQKYNNLDILSAPYRYSEDNPSSEGWPSWVPDWGRRGIKEFDFVNREALGRKKAFRDFFCAAGDHSDVEFMTPPVGDSNQLIAFMGIDFDEVVAVVEGDVFDDPGAVSGEKEAWRVWHRFATEDSIHSDYPAVYEDNEEAYWRTLVADSDGEGGFAPSEFGVMYRRWRAGSGLDPRVRPGELPLSRHYTAEETEQFASFANALWLATRGRKLFRTKRGYLGLGTWEMEPGFRIHILNGGSLPVVGEATGAFVTQVGENEEGVEVEEEESFPIYRLVGSGGVYLHGIMDGEVLGIAENEGLEVKPVCFC
jgi:Heterokaryon incompatibility protein (HET)